MDYHKLSEVMTLITGPVPDVVSLLEPMNTSPGTWYEPINLEKYLFLYSCH